MAKSIKFREFTDGNKTVSFSSVRFRAVLRDWQNQQKEETGTKPSLDDVYKMIADRVHVSTDAVKNWDRGNNGVNDFAVIKEIAYALNVDYKNLIVNSEQKTEELQSDFSPVGNNEKDLIIQTHQLFNDYIYWFCGTISENYASHVMEHPEEEQEEYISKLYYFLDQISLSISIETYEKLRKTITELVILSTPLGAGSLMIPFLWAELNPRLNSDAFQSIYCPYVDNEDLYSIIDEEKLSGSEIDSLLHAIIEDIPEIVDNLYNKHSSTLTEENKTSSKIYDGLFWELHRNLPPLYEIITRELASTLTKVMRARFPKHFVN